MRHRGGWRGSVVDLYFSLGLRRDALFEVCDAVLGKQERVLMLAEVSLEPECRCGHGGVYAALNSGEVRFEGCGWRCRRSRLRLRLGELD